MDLYNRISISGKMASGKTTIADKLNRDYGYEYLRSAEYLKKLCSVMVQLNIFKLSGNESKALNDSLCTIIWKLCDDVEDFPKIKLEVDSLRKQFAHVLSFESKSNDYREMLQVVAQVLLDGINPGIWINSALSNMADDKLYVHDDLRYPFEYNRLKQEKFILVRLEISQEEQRRRVKNLYGKIAPERFQHISEIALDDTLFDYYLDGNEPEDVVYHKIKNILNIRG